MLHNLEHVYVRTVAIHVRMHRMAWFNWFESLLTIQLMPFATSIFLKWTNEAFPLLSFNPNQVRVSSLVRNCTCPAQFRPCDDPDHHYVPHGDPACFFRWPQTWWYIFVTLKSKITKAGISQLEFPSLKGEALASSLILSIFGAG